MVFLQSPSQPNLHKLCFQLGSLRLATLLSALTTAATPGPLCKERVRHAGNNLASVMAPGAQEASAPETTEQPGLGPCVEKHTSGNVDARKMEGDMTLQEDVQKDPCILNLLAPATACNLFAILSSTT